MVFAQAKTYMLNYVYKLFLLPLNRLKSLNRIKHTKPKFKLRSTEIQLKPFKDNAVILLNFEGKLALSYPFGVTSNSVFIPIKNFSKNLSFFTFTEMLWFCSSKF